ncbi:microcompartment protein PduM [Citrobacter rodentium]|jgi:hypothetical protein|uniref:Propanediol utilization protein n=2 Tax=Citrobacter rodentium TaxID=67825 RepID=D2TPR6_CITRI|nr:microcompartment protein PduM [Citrobacter rodentium]KIQ50895.1 propanediol utilization protein [Citrobacter rodentium]QBY28659.1 microcompartment protein PduM [Citrobacter rodentium]UHO29471.1 microcompartment protein PduM [Citrobacter rodentium NBRC 105723 = DSM 16636]CBG88883.1 propanediol utilization protein [Citrobacter rodentium ICC168]HAT8011877.1 microcompartment protein PduM [Citrobacter rodentium NBRC 105723 = DSM 16636]
MNDELLQRIVEEVVARLRQRADSAIALSVAQLRETPSRTLFCRYAALHVLQADLSLLRQIAENDRSDSAAALLHDALASGLRVRISLQRALLPALPVKKLARLPLTFCDEQGMRVMLHPTRLVTYADVVRSDHGLLVLPRKCIVTALARDAASSRNIQFFKQE